MMLNNGNYFEKLHELEEKEKLIKTKLTSLNVLTSGIKNRLAIVNSEISETHKSNNLASTAGSSYNQLKIISSSIERHYRLENQERANIHAIARAEYGYNAMCWVVNYLPQRYMKSYYVDQYGLVHAQFVDESDYFTVLKSDGMTISKNTRMGEAIIKFKYTDAGLINNRAFWNVTNGIRDITINISGDYNTYTFNTLEKLTSQFYFDEIKYKEKLKIKESLLANQKENETNILLVKKELEQIAKAKERAEEEIKRTKDISEREKAEVERRRQEELEREAKAKEEQLRMEAENQAKEEEALRQQLAAIKKNIEEDQQKIQVARSFIREDNSLRSQHFLDEYQEDAKRSHFFDGIPIIIEGGPGTGKTTTMIQRLKFLLSSEAHFDYKPPISEEFKEMLLDPEKINSNWLFISPTRQLLHFLRNNMQMEGLKAYEANTKTISKFRMDMLHEYKLLKNADSNGPFKVLEFDDDEKVDALILKTYRIAKSFESFIIESITCSLKKACKINTSGFEWRMEAEMIKRDLQRFDSIKDINDLIRMVNNLRINEKNTISSRSNKLRSDIDDFAGAIISKVMRDVTIMEEISMLFKNWNGMSNFEEEEFNDELEIIEDGLNLQSSSLDVKAKMLICLRPIIKKLALQKFESQKLNKREEELYNILSRYINELKESDNGVVNKYLFCIISDNAWFVKNFAMLCNGVSSIIILQIPRLYKLYRKAEYNSKSDIYNNYLLGTIIKMDSNKYLHKDELDFVIGFINNLILKIYKYNRPLFKELNNKYVEAYKNSVKPVIGIDEATDYSLMDYYFINSFRHYQYNSLTLCGDMMQGLSETGIERWSDLSTIIGTSPHVVELKTSYRQLPTLVDMSRKMYFDDQCHEAPYQSKKTRSDNDPLPLKFISNDEEEKALWLAKRINEIYRDYDQHIPSVAIFIGENVDAKKFIKRLKSNFQYLNGIRVEDCTDNRQAEGTDVVRVFNLKEVKGMEFEVALFHNLDTSLDTDNMKLLRRYLYVGISRAATHLAATFTKADGNENILSYFDKDATSWR